MTDESDSDCLNYSDNSSLKEQSHISSSILYRKERILIPSRDRSHNYYIDDSTSESDCFVSDCELNSNENEHLKLIRYNNYIYNILNRNNYRSWGPVSGGYVDPNSLNLRQTTFSKSRDFGVHSGVSDIVNYPREFSYLAGDSSISESHLRKSTCKSKTNNKNISVNKRSNCSKSIINSDQLHDRLSSTGKNMSPEKNVLSSSKRKRTSIDNLKSNASVRTKRTKFNNETDAAVNRKQTLITDLVYKTNRSRSYFDPDSSSDVFVKQHSSRPNEKNNSVNVKNFSATSKSNPNLKSVENHHSSSSISEDEGSSGTGFREDSSPTNCSRLGTQEINFDAGLVSRRSRNDSISKSSCGSDYNETVVNVKKSKKKDLVDSNLSLSEMPDSFPRRSINNKSHEKVQSSKNVRRSTTLHEDDDFEHDASLSKSKDRSKLLPHSEKSLTKNNDRILENSSSKRSTKKHELSESEHSSQNFNLSKRKNSSNYSSDDVTNEERSENFSKIIVRRSSVDSFTNENTQGDGHHNSESEITDIERGKFPSKKDKQRPSVVSSVNDDITNRRVSRNSSFLKDSEENNNSCRIPMSIDTRRRTSPSSSDGCEDNRKKNKSRNSSISQSEDGEVIHNRYETPSDRHRRSSKSSDRSENNRRQERSGNSSLMRSEVAGMKNLNMSRRKSFSDSSENETRENVPVDSRRRQSFSTNNGSEDARQKEKARTSDVRNKRHSFGSPYSSDDERTKDRRQISSSRTTLDINSTFIQEKAKKRSTRDDTLLQTPGFMNSLKYKATSTPFNKHANDKRIESNNVQDGQDASCNPEEETFVNNQVDRYIHHIIPEALKNIDEKLVQGIRSEQFEEDLLFVEDISDNDEIWVAQCPKSLKVESLLGKKFDLNGVTTLKGSTKDGDGSVDYEAFTSALSNNGDDENEQNVLSKATASNVYCLIPSRKQQKLKLKAIKTKGTIKIEERIALPTPNTIKFTSSTEISLPECLKIRHPLLGSDFSEQLKALEYLNRSCNATFEGSHERKKRRKRGQSVSENHGNEAYGDGDDDVDLSHEKKKKKKRKHKTSLNEDDGQAGFHQNNDTFLMEEETEGYEAINKKKKKKKKHTH